MAADNRAVGLGFTGVGVLAVLAAMLPGSGSVGAPALERRAVVSSPDSGAAKPARVRAYREGAALLGAFFGGSFTDSSLHDERYDLDVLIATLPDPVESHLDWAFDSELEAIRRAYERMGYVTDRFWLPPPGSVVARHAKRSPVPAREVYPAVMLFRNVDPSKQDLRLLYVVGEVPTAGIHKQAFVNALKEREWLLSARRKDSSSLHTLRILGPAFSGSVSSLRLTLKDWFEDAPKHPLDRAEIVSGSATNRNNRCGLRLSNQVSFRTSVHTDEAMSAALRDVLDSLGVEASQVALLREATTQYGNRMRRYGQAIESTCGTDTAAATPFLDLPFPMNISSLRTEYARNPAAQGAAGTLPGGPAIPHVPLSLDDSTRPRENPAVTSALTAASADAQLDVIAQTLRDHQIRAVGLIATDVRDKLFLGTEIRKRVHDVQLFTYESNILYLRPDLNEWLRGMLVFSTYPLLPPNQRWTPSRNGSQQLAFSSDGAEGTYNAALVLLGGDTVLTEYGGPIPLQQRPDRTPPVWVTAVGRTSFLPVATIREADSSLYATRNPPTGDPRSQEAPLAASGFLGFVAALVLGLAICILAIQSLPSARLRAARAVVLDPRRSTGIVKETIAGTPERKVPATTDWTRLSEAVRAASLQVHQELYVVLLFIALGGMFAPAAALLLRVSTDLGPRTASWVFVAVVALAWSLAMVLRVIATVRLGARYSGLGWRYATGAWGPFGEHFLWISEVVARALVVLAAAVYAYLTARYTVNLWNLDHRLDAAALHLFFHRATQVDGGLSPVLPLVVTGLGFGAWCLWHLERVALLSQETSLEEAAKRRTGDDKRETLWGSVEQVRSRLFLVIPDGRAVYLLAFLALLSLWLLPRFGRSIESLILPRSSLWPLRGDWPNSFDLLFRVAVLGTLAATPWAVYRFLAVWSALQSCLRKLGSSPLVEAFDRLPPRIARLTRLTLFSVPRPYAISDVAETQWKHLDRIYEEKRDEFTAILTGDEPLLERIKAVVKAPRPRISRQEERVAATAGGLADVYRILEGLWDLEPTVAEIDRAVTQVAKPEAVNTTSMLRQSFADPVRLWLRLAEEFVAVQVVDYVEWVLRHLRVLAVFLLLALLLTTALLSCYPFQPQTLVKLVFFFIVIGTIGAIVLVMSRLNRDEVLSRITQTEPGRITWNASFILNLLVFGAVPLIALISSEFPGVRDFLFSWLSPVLKAAAKS